VTEASDRDAEKSNAKERQDARFWSTEETCRRSEKLGKPTLWIDYQIFAGAGPAGTKLSKVGLEKRVSVYGIDGTGIKVHPDFVAYYGDEVPQLARATPPTKLIVYQVDAKVSAKMVRLPIVTARPVPAPV